MLINSGIQICSTINNGAIRTLEDMILDNNFTDVTIVSDDYIEFKAHIIVLSSSPTADGLRDFY